MNEGTAGPPTTVIRERRVADKQQAITEDQQRRAVLIWEYHQMHLSRARH